MAYVKEDVYQSVGNALHCQSRWCSHCANKSGADEARNSFLVFGRRCRRRQHKVCTKSFRLWKRAILEWQVIQIRWCFVFFFSPCTMDFHSAWAVIRWAWQSQNEYHSWWDSLFATVFVSFLFYHFWGKIWMQGFFFLSCSFDIFFFSSLFSLICQWFVCKGHSPSFSPAFFFLPNTESNFLCIFSRSVLCRLWKMVSFN